MISVERDYKHMRKLLTSGEPIVTPQIRLKWYGLHPADRPIPYEVTREARAVTAREIPAEAGELGFVILHRVGDNYLLLINTWRNENELWETVYFKTDGPFELVKMDDTHKATFCVWEMGALVHEQQAWITYLFSGRDEAAARVYLDDVRPQTLV